MGFDCLGIVQASARGAFNLPTNVPEVNVLYGDRHEMQRTERPLLRTFLHSQNPRGGTPS